MNIQKKIPHINGMNYFYFYQQNISYEEKNKQMKPKHIKNIKIITKYTYIPIIVVSFIENNWKNNLLL